MNFKRLKEPPAARFCQLQTFIFLTDYIIIILIAKLWSTRLLLVFEKHTYNIFNSVNPLMDCYQLVNGLIESLIL